MDTSAARSGATEAPREVELKLELDPDQAARLGQASLIRGVEGRTEALTTVYFDTDDLALRAAGLSLRVRHLDGRRVQTIKSQGAAAAGLFDRDEWEQDIDGDGPDLAAAAGTALQPALDGGGVRDGIRPIFTVRVDRTTYPLASEAWAAELTLDQGRVEGQGRASALCEIELELKRGQTSDLFAIARSLSDEVPVRLGVRTKAERGYDLVLNQPLRAVKAKGSTLSPGMTTAAAFQAIGRACLRHLMSNERILHDTRDPDVVHQMRVALRRLRAAISLFKTMLADERRDAIRGELKWISNELGAARDLDVFIAKALQPVVAGRPDEPGLAALLGAFERRREQAYEAALAAVESQRFRTLTIDVAAWLEAGSWLTADRSARAEPIEAFAAEELARRRKKVRKRGAHLADLSAHDRHQVRIEVKKLRYAAEFFAPLYEGGKSEKRKKALLSALESLQEHLGDLNDVAVSQELHPELFRSRKGVDGEDAPSRRAARLVVKHLKARAEASLKPALRAFRDFDDAKPFWK